MSGEPAPYMAQNQQRDNWRFSKALRKENEPKFLTES